MRISDWSSDVGSSDLGDKDADHDVELEQPDQKPAPLCRADLGDIDRRQHRRSADREPAEETERDERAQIPACARSDRRDDIAQRDHNPHGAAADPEIGKAPCRERECQYVSILVGAEAIKKKKQKKIK